MPCPEKFRESLKKFGVVEEIINKVNEGYEDLVSSSPKKDKASYFKRAVDILENNIDDKDFKEIFMYNSCCKGGSREKAAKAFAKENKDKPLKEKLEVVKGVPWMGKPVLNEDGTITLNAVNYFDGNKFLCACSNFNWIKSDYYVSKKYCYCCSGHFKHHYEIMLGLKIKDIDIITSPLDSNGKNSCAMKFYI